MEKDKKPRPSLHTKVEASAEVNLAVWLALAFGTVCRRGVEEFAPLVHKSH